MWGDLKKETKHKTQNGYWEILNKIMDKFIVVVVANQIKNTCLAKR
jgi:hypothetical protein